MNGKWVLFWEKCLSEQSTQMGFFSCAHTHSHNCTIMKCTETINGWACSAFNFIQMLTMGATEGLTIVGIKEIGC